MDNLTITWRKEWIISRYESPWGIFQKFKLANEANDHDLLRVFGLESIKTQTPSFLNENHRNLITMEAFDSKSLKKYLKCDIKTLNKKNLNKIFDGKTNNLSLSYFFRKKIHYCPKCMEFGFHSIFHQLTFIDECPFHNIGLISKCPKCSSTIAYELNNTNAAPQPFHCICGYSISVDGSDFYRFKNKWSSKQVLKINSTELDILFKLTVEQQHKIQRIYINNKFLNQQNPRLMKFILSVIDDSYVLKNDFLHNKVISTPIIQKIMINLTHISSVIIIIF